MDDVTAGRDCAAVLLRLAGLPIASWLAGAAPGLMALVTDVDRLADAYQRHSDQVVADIGGRLIGHPALLAAQWPDVLHLRRALRNGWAPPPAASSVADSAELVLPDGDPLPVRIRTLVKAAAELAALRESADHAVAAEERRLLAAPWQLLHDSASGRHAVRANGMHRDTAARVAAGEPWTTRRMRQRAESLWRLIDHGGTRATPDGWLGQVALVPVVPDGWTGDRLLIQDRAAAECTDSDQVRRTGWSTVERVPANNVDVYRRSATGVAESHATRLAELVHLGLRALVLASGTVAAPALPAQLGPRPRLLPNLATERWVPVAPAPGPGPLDRWIGEHADGADSIDVDIDTLDRLGAPTPAVDWPVDCLLRPIRAHDGPVAVLDRICPAGVLDARFASAMRDLYPRVPQADEYRRFLCEIGARAGIPVVEVLVPPTTAPTYSSWWTGDPARAGQPGIYVSPARITLRTDAGQVIAEVDGRRIWPVGHTTHAAPPPWDRLSALLMLASPQPPAWSWRPVCPDRDHVPRITVGGGLVVSVERWRLPCGQLWQRRDRPLDKVTALLRLRRRHGLPRWVTVAAADGPVVLDLDSLRSIPVIERLASRGVTCLDVSELLPNPNQLPVRDESAGGASVAELVLRLPWRQTGRSVW